ncbi:hypothetical protein B6U90_07360 [Thermoplasmatales archaeon ex4484_6]|nr:MAG: hypothetical protein B6U90_07360 [Thermoplasmatales archaeon ex4484_6]RLF66198.1 MAG: hypothetical protein DRN57_07555 [Thermoplasmata archaeon]
MYSAIAYDGKVKDIVDLPIEKHTIIISDYIALELRMNILSKVSEQNKQAVIQRTEDLIETAFIKKKEEYVNSYRMP